MHGEMYSAPKAEVVIESDPYTRLDRGLLEWLLTHLSSTNPAATIVLD